MILNGRMLIILVKTTANTNNSILAKSIAAVSYTHLTLPTNREV